jgi:hypothetical protein
MGENGRQLLKGYRCIGEGVKMKLWEILADISYAIAFTVAIVSIVLGG